MVPRTRSASALTVPSPPAATRTAGRCFSAACASSRRSAPGASVKTLASNPASRRTLQTCSTPRLEPALGLTMIRAVLAAERLGARAYKQKQICKLHAQVGCFLLLQVRRQVALARHYGLHRPRQADHRIAFGDVAGCAGVEALAHARHILGRRNDQHRHGREGALE